MLYPHDYHLVEESHCYKFKDLNLSINLCPAHYAVPEIKSKFNVYLVDIIRHSDKNGILNFGKTASNILFDFICSDTTRAIGFYPSDKENTDLARIKLFTYWEKNINTTEIVKLKNTVTMVNDELSLVMYFHENYPMQNELIAQFNDFSKVLNSK